MQKSRITVFLLFSIITFSFLLAKNSLAVTFDPGNIISDEEMLDYKSMTIESIQQFLEAKGSYLAKYSTTDASGNIKKVSQIIYDATTNNYDCDKAKNLSINPSIEEKAEKCISVRINPKFILVLLQKEQGLIESSAPRQSQLDWALGYGCPDGDACNTRWKGIGKQINSSVLQYFDYIANPQRYKYQVGQSYTFTNSGGYPPMLVTPANRATAGLYNYTPHVYFGNFNFFKLWQRYFTHSILNGSLIQAKGVPGVWLIENGQKRPFLSRGALTSRYDINKIITVNKSDLDNYPLGPSIKFSQYSVVRVSSGALFLLIDDKRRGFTSQEAFRKTGINPEEIITATYDDLKNYKEIEPITATTTYPTGALLQNTKTGGIYWVADGGKSPIWDKVLLKTKFRFKAIHAMTPQKLDNYATKPPVMFDDGELLKTTDSSAVYVITNGQKRIFTTGKLFEDMGYKWSNVITVTPKLLNLYADGDPIVEIAINNITIELSTSTPFISTSTSISTSTLSTATTTQSISTSTNLFPDVPTSTISQQK